MDSLTLTAATTETSPGFPGLEISALGSIEYLAAWQLQRDLHTEVADGSRENTLLLVEHPSVYTAGRRTDLADRPINGVPVIDVDRGGKITWHGPGQLVGYPIVRLPSPLDVIAHVRRIEGLLIDVCSALGVASARIPGRSGVWIPADGRGPDRKVAAIGIRVTEGVTLHGFALNCDCDMSWFDKIVPCGIKDAEVTSLSRELSRSVSVAEVLPIVIESLPVVLHPVG